MVEGILLRRLCRDRSGDRGHCHGDQVTRSIRRVVLLSAGAGFIQGVTQTWVVFHLLAACMSGKAETVPGWSGREAYAGVQPITRAWAANSHHTYRSGDATGNKRLQNPNTKRSALARTMREAVAAPRIPQTMGSE